MMLVNIDAINAVCHLIRRFGRNLYNEKNISAMNRNAMNCPMLYSTVPITSFRTPSWPSTTRPLRRRECQVRVERRVRDEQQRRDDRDLNVENLSGDDAAVGSMSKICASTLRSDPNSRVENQMKPMTLYNPIACRDLMMSMSTLRQAVTVPPGIRRKESVDERIDLDETMRRPTDSADSRGPLRREGRTERRRAGC